MKTHDPMEHIRGLQLLLISDKKRIAFLFGAGTSLAKKNDKSIFIPAIDDLTKQIENELCKDSFYEKALAEIKQELEEKGKYTVETLLSNIDQKCAVIGKGKLNGLKEENFIKLKTEIKKSIKEKMAIHKDFVAENSIHVDFAEWIGRANKKYAIEIFTTNYDYFFELGLEHKKIPYYDGFTGSFCPFFNADSIEKKEFLPDQTKLWKMHGSLGWYYDEENEKIIRKENDSDDLLIYPTLLKYEESKKQPYIALSDRLTNFLKQSDTILITCGYSFGDEHINERILTALKSNPLTHVYVLLHDELKEDSTICNIAKLERKISIYSRRHAVIGSQYGIWKLNREPDKDDPVPVHSFFDVDAFNSLEIEIGKEFIGNEVWTGEGELRLPDFRFFVTFLQDMMFPENINSILSEEGKNK